MGGVWIGAFLASLDSTLVATLAGPFSASFDSLTLLSWLASAYFIANAVSQPLAGKLTDIYSRRADLLFSNALFGIGNLICALGRSEKVMIFGRMVAGIGGGGVGPILTFLASDLIPLRRKGVWQGFANILFGIGSGLGGPFGGWVNDRFSWRWAFFLQVPLTLVAIVLDLVTVNAGPPSTEEPRKDPKFKMIDYVGAILLVASLVTTLFSLNAGGNLVPETHPLVLVSLPFSVICSLCSSMSKMVLPLNP